MAAPRPPFHGEGAVFAVLDASANNVVAVDPDGRIGYVNGRTLNTFGYSEQELLGAPVEMLVPEVLAEKHERHRRDFAEHPLPRPMGLDLDLSGRRRDGSLFPVEISLTPLDTDHGLWVIAAVADVSARRAVEAHARALGRAYVTLARMNEAIVRATDPDDLFRATCRVAVEQGGYLGAWIARPGQDHAVTMAASAGSLDEYFAQLTITTDPTGPEGHGPTARALREGEPYYSRAFMTDPATRPWHALAEAYGIRASATLPIRQGGRVVAALNLYSGDADPFDEQMSSLLEGMATNVSFALEGFEAAVQLERVAAHRSELLRRLVAAQEGERGRIAADVHDDSVQALAAVDLRLGLLRRSAEETAPELTGMVDQLQEIVGAVADGLRQLLFELEPAEPGTTLVAMLEAAAAHVFEGTDVAWAVEVVPEAGSADDAALTEHHLASLPEPVRVQASRVSKEALINVRKHAHASRVAVVVTPGRQGVEVAVTDDGVGVDPAEVASAPGHRGLATMRDRAEVAGGWCRLEPADRGTTLRFWMPRLAPGTAPARRPVVPTGPE